MSAVVYVAAHKACDLPDDPAYRPIHVGHQNASVDLGFAGDDTGDNISAKNPTYCELTALYWMWKNTADDAYGLAHYRRYFAGAGWRGIATGDELDDLLEKHDVVLSRPRNYYVETVRSHYAHAHHEGDLDIVRGAVGRQSPDYLPAFDTVMAQRRLSLYNMFLMRRQLLGEYCAWLFPILEECEREIPVDTYDNYQARVYGFLGERLLNVWVTYRRSDLDVGYRPVRNLDGERYLKKAVGLLRRKFDNSSH